MKNKRIDQLNLSDEDKKELKRLRNRKRNGKGGYKEDQKYKELWLNSK